MRLLTSSLTASILLKNPSGQKETVKRTISDVSLGHSNRVQTKLARKNFQHFSYSFTHLQNRGVLQQNRYGVFADGGGHAASLDRHAPFADSHEPRLPWEPGDDALHPIVVPAPVPDD